MIDIKILRWLLDTHPSVDKFYGTDDQQFFQAEIDALNHAKDIGGKVTTHRRRDREKRAAAPELPKQTEGTAPEQSEEEDDTDASAPKKEKGKKQDDTAKGPANKDKKR